MASSEWKTLLKENSVLLPNPKQHGLRTMPSQNPHTCPTTSNRCRTSPESNLHNEITTAVVYGPIPCPVLPWRETTTEYRHRPPMHCIPVLHEDSMLHVEEGEGAFSCSSPPTTTPLKRRYGQFGPAELHSKWYLVSYDAYCHSKSFIRALWSVGLFQSKTCWH